MGQGSGGGGIPGMGFLQMAMNGFGGGDKGGGPQQPAAPGGLTAPPAGNPPASPNQGANPLLKMMPGYSSPMPLYGNMEDDDLLSYMAANGIRKPQGPKPKPATSGTSAPVVNTNPGRRYGDGR